MDEVDRLGMGFENLMGKSGNGGGQDGRLAMYRGDSSSILRIIRVRFLIVRDNTKDFLQRKKVKLYHENLWNGLK